MVLFFLALILELFEESFDFFDIWVVFYEWFLIDKLKVVWFMDGSFKDDK